VFQIVILIYFVNSETFADDQHDRFKSASAIL
jgi:hypothetical protein